SSLNAFWTSMRTRHTRRLSRRQEGERQRNAQDDEIFNRTRLVNCGCFMNIILRYYVDAILGLVRDQSDWHLDPLQPIREASHDFTPLGEGNVVSVEFNLLYRWHSTLSAQDTEWFENDVFKRAFPGVNPAELTTQQSSSRQSRMAWPSRRGAIPGNGHPAGKLLKRDASGRFKDGDLANVLQNATDWYAGAFKARCIPETLRMVELMAIEQSRTWGTCPEWNPDPKVEKTLELIKTKAIEKIGTRDRFVDVIKDVINLLPIHWLSQEVAGFPLKTEKTQKGQWYEGVTYDRWSDIAEYIYLDFDPVNDWRLRESSQVNAHECISAIAGHLDRVSLKLWEDHGKSNGIPVEFAAYLFAATVPTATLYSQALSHIVNFYLQDERKARREEIVVLSKSTDKDANAKIMRHAYEALRLHPITAGVYRTAIKAGSIGPVEVQGGQSVSASIIDANTDTVPPVLGVIFGLKDLKRGPNESGKLLTFTEDFHGAKRVMYPSQRGLVTPWPESLILEVHNSRR
ncbi:hypothetical protein BDN70DRAFT_900339, partial [Pholiota conissans]